MSRWSADPLRIALAPGEAALLRRGGTPVSRVLTTPERGAASLLPLLDEAFADPSWRGRRAEVVLSQHFVRLILTPPPGKALAPAEERTLVETTLRGVYGDMIDRWTFQVVSQPPQFGLLGAALESEFMQQLDALLARHGFRDAKIRPLASFAARRLPREFAGWWALAEPGWLCLFGGANGRWQYFVDQPVDGDWAEGLPERVEREAGLSALPLPLAVWVQAVGTGTVVKPASGSAGWQVLPCDAAARGALAMAGI